MGIGKELPVYSVKESACDFEFRCYYCDATQSELLENNSALRMEWISPVKFRMICNDCRINQFGKHLYFDGPIEVTIRRS